MSDGLSRAIAPHADHRVHVAAFDAAECVPGLRVNLRLDGCEFHVRGTAAAVNAPEIIQHAGLPQMLNGPETYPRMESDVCSKAHR